MTRSDRWARATLFAAFAAAATAACGANGRSDSASGSTDPSNVGWPGYNKSPDGQRYATLDEINATNVARLRPICELRLGEEGPFQTGPVVVGNTMFLTEYVRTLQQNRPQ
jgi:glucose dehydrogenase